MSRPNYVAARGVGAGELIRRQHTWEYVGLDRGLYRDNGKQNGNYYSVLGIFLGSWKKEWNYYDILGSYRNDGKENGSYYLGLGV